jgi:hypothetical protein
MDGQTMYTVVKELAGNINPAGETHVDEKRYDNLKNLCYLVENLLTDIDDMAFSYRKYHEASIKRSVDHANKFIKGLGIVKE